MAANNGQFGIWGRNDTWKFKPPKFPWWKEQLELGLTPDEIRAKFAKMPGAKTPQPPAAKFPWWTAQREAGLTPDEIRAKFAKMSGKVTTPEAPATPAPPVLPGTYRRTLNAIGQIVRGISDPTAKAWARALWDVYRDYTPSRGMRQSEQEARFQAQLEELLASIPESAQPYAAAMQRLVQPTVLRPEQEWYEFRAPQRTAPTNWSVAGGLTSNPYWL